MSKDRKPLPPSDHRSLYAIDAIVLGTVNASYKRSISAGELAEVLATGKSGQWPVHVATFFTDVRPALVIEFATAHGVSHIVLEAAYMTTKRMTGERNSELEATFVALAQAA